MPSVRAYVEAFRPFSFTATVIPTVMGTVIALALHGADPAFHFRWGVFGLTLLGCLAVHASCNLISEYYDWRTGLDRAENSGARNILVQRLLTPRQVLIEAVIAMALALGAGAGLTAMIGPAVLWFVAFGALSAVFYSVPPLELKYRGFGDLQVILSFGAVMTLGAYYVQAHAVMALAWSSPLLWKVLLYSIPSGLLIDAILHANNHRDIPSDGAQGITTVAILLGERASMWFEFGLILGAYGLILVMVALEYLTPVALVTVLTLPKALVVLRKIRSGRERLEAAAFNTMDVDAAQLHTAFGAAMIAGFVASYLLRV